MVLAALATGVVAAAFTMLLYSTLVERLTGPEAPWSIFAWAAGATITLCAFLAPLLWTLGV